MGEWRGEGYRDGDTSGGRMGVEIGIGWNHKMCGIRLEMMILMKSGWE